MGHARILGDKFVPAAFPPTAASTITLIAMIVWLCVAPCLATGCAGLSEPDVSIDRPILATAGQLERERLALEVLASPALQRGVDSLEALYRAHSRGATQAGYATARRAAESTAMAAVHTTVIEDPDRPVVFWGVNAAHRWFDLTLPRSGFGIENPDNIYRHFDVDGESRYVVEGRFVEPRPAELHLVVMESVPGESAMNAEGSRVLSALRSDALEVAPDGRFTITIDADPPNGRANHLAIPAQGHYPVYVRDLFTDWSTQNPAALEIRRTQGPTASEPPTMARLTERAARRLASMGPFWLEFNDRFVYAMPANEPTPPRMRPGGRGSSSIGHFALAHDEALVVTLDRLGAGSLGIQLADPFGVAYEYVERTSSLNHAQAVANPDGSFTFVISVCDPGIHNWLDPEDQSSGIFVLRWQILPEGVRPEDGIRSVRVVKQGSLLEALPKKTRFVTPEGRRMQRSERARQYRRRLTRVSQ